MVVNFVSAKLTTGDANGEGRVGIGARHSDTESQPIPVWIYSCRYFGEGSYYAALVKYA